MLHIHIPNNSYNIDEYHQNVIIQRRMRILFCVGHSGVSRQSNRSHFHPLRDDRAQHRCGLVYEVQIENQFLSNH